MLMDRIIGVFKLSVPTFEEIEHDQNATGQAAIVVAIVALMSALGSGMAAAWSENPFITSFISALVWTFVGWVLWAAVTYFVGTALFGGKATLNEMLRVIGFAYAPQFLAIIPCIGGLVGAVWSLAAAFVAIRQGLDLDNMRALLTAVVGFIVYMLGSALINLLIGGVTGLF